MTAVCDSAVAPNASPLADESEGLGSTAFEGTPASTVIIGMLDEQFFSVDPSPAFAFARVVAVMSACVSGGAAVTGCDVRGAGTGVVGARFDKVPTAPIKGGFIPCPLALSFFEVADVRVEFTPIRVLLGNAALLFQF